MLTENKRAPCAWCNNKMPNYAVGCDRQGLYYIRCRKCEKYVFVDADINVVRREFERLNGKDN